MSSPYSLWIQKKLFDKYQWSATTFLMQSQSQGFIGWKGLLEVFCLTPCSVEVQLKKIACEPVQLHFECLLIPVFIHYHVLKNKKNKNAHSESPILPHGGVRPWCLWVHSNSIYFTNLCPLPLECFTRYLQEDWLYLLCVVPVGMWRQQGLPWAISSKEWKDHVASLIICSLVHLLYSAKLSWFGWDRVRFLHIHIVLCFEFAMRIMQWDNRIVWVGMDPYRSFSPSSCH